MEVLGGSGYIEESIMPRLYREAPVNSIWEGSGNVMCLDVLRAIGPHAECGGRVAQRTGGGDPRLKAFADRLSKRLGAPTATTRRRRARWCATWCWRCRRRC